MLLSESQKLSHAILSSSSSETTKYITTNNNTNNHYTTAFYWSKKHHHHHHQQQLQQQLFLNATVKTPWLKPFVLVALVLLTSIEESVSLFLNMGLLKVGVPKSWDDSKKDLKYIREAGVRQFISTYNRVKDLKGDDLLWGDEIEYQVFRVNHAEKKIRLSLRAKEIMDWLNENEQAQAQVMEGCNWVPEYGAWMVEATPRRPYAGYTSDLLRVERSMRLRRKRLLAALHDDEIAPTISAYFMLGAQGDDGSVPPTKVGGPVTESEYVSDGIINPHPRFGTLTANIRQRRGSKVNIRVPLFRDRNTPEYAGYPPPPVDFDTDGCCGGDSQQLWRYGKGDASMEKHGRDYVVVGCSKSSSDEEFDDSAAEQGLTLQKWLVDVQCEGCIGLFYRRSIGEIAPDADWPRNGDIVVGHELEDHPGWIRLQNGYYLPIRSDDGLVPFLHKVSVRAQPNNSELKRIGANVPLFRSSGDMVNLEVVASLLEDDDDKGTTEPKNDKALPTSNSNGNKAVLPSPLSSSDAGVDNENIRPSIHMDAMAFGMGNGCLQITFQAKDIEESRFMCDQLAVMAPIMMALTASTPILKGRIADIDTRWGVISESVDCRTLAERGRNDPNAPYPEYNSLGKRRIFKSRYDSISTYIFQGSVASTGDNSSGIGTNRVLNIYNDIPVSIDENSYKQLRNANVDPALAQHIAHLFIRDPLVVFDGAVEEVDDETQTEHFESIQSTNWQTVRWKPPPPRNSPNDPHIGWRSEFRSMEMQLTDFENAAFAAFIMLLTRVILAFDLNLYIPLSRVDANMQRAHSRNAAAKGKFFFRRHLAPLEEGDYGYGVTYVSMFSRAANETVALPVPDVIDSNIDPTHTNHTSSSSGNNSNNSDVSDRRLKAPSGTSTTSEENSYEEMTMAEIMCGKGDYFPGLIPLVLAYLDHIKCDRITRQRVNMYLDFIERRAKGELVTPATWIRNFVRTHPLYKHDSIVTDEIAYDLMIACKDIGEGRMHVPELLGTVQIEPISPEGAYETKLESGRVQNERLLGLLQRYTNRRCFSSKVSCEDFEMNTDKYFYGQGSTTNIDNDNNTHMNVNDLATTKKVMNGSKDLCSITSTN